MIQKSEIESKAKEFQIPETSVEKDYVFGWLLFGIFTSSSIKDEIFLKGGNALRKGYFDQTRYSNDLDFGIPHDINQDELREEINKVCLLVQENSGIVFETEDTKIKEKFIASEQSPLPDLKVYEVKVYFKDFRGVTDSMRLKIMMDLTRFDRPLLDIQSVPMIHPYSDAGDLVCNIRCMKLEEIIATKLKFVLQREHAPDLFDYVHAIKLMGGVLNKDEVVECLIDKTIYRPNPYVLKRILVEMPYDFFRKHWIKAIIIAKHLIIEFEEALKIFLAELEAIFQQYPDNGYAIIFFGPELRNPIMEAGRNMKLLKIRYNCEDRICEPYSLKYMQQKSGRRREYFFVYNRSGGNSEPGIRMFVPENVQSIEITDESFEPRYEVELSKAGERPEDPYLFDPNRPAKRAVSIGGSIGRKHTGLKYKYKCSYCGKIFTKTKQDSSVGPHKKKEDIRVAEGLATTSELVISKILYMNDNLQVKLKIIVYNSELIHYLKSIKRINIHIAWLPRGHR